MNQGRMLKVKVEPAPACFLRKLRYINELKREMLLVCLLRLNAEFMILFSCNFMQSYSCFL